MGYGLENQEIGVPFLEGEIFFSSPRHSDWEPANICCTLSPGVKLTTHFHLVPRLRVDGTIPSRSSLYDAYISKEITSSLPYLFIQNDYCSQVFTNQQTINWKTPVLGCDVCGSTSPPFPASLMFFPVWLILLS
jgi:hypothetical protein